MTSPKNGRPLWPAIAAANSVSGLLWGATLYAAPDYFFGPSNGIWPDVWKKTALESNDLDPITIHYSRCAGAGLLTICLAHFLLFDNANFVACSRALTRMSISLFAAYIAFWINVLLDTSGSFHRMIHVILLGQAILMILYDLRCLKQLRMSTISSAATTTTTTKVQRMTNMVTVLYGGFFCLTRGLGGASRFFFPNTPLENNEFDANMNTAARNCAASLVALVYGALVEGNHVPDFIIKMGCLFGVLILPIFFKAAHESYFNQQGFTILTVVHCLWLLLVFHAAGAFTALKNMPKKMTKKTE